MQEGETESVQEGETVSVQEGETVSVQEGETVSVQGKTQCVEGETQNVCRMVRHTECAGR